MDGWMNRLTDWRQMEERLTDGGMTGGVEKICTGGDEECGNGKSESE